MKLQAIERKKELLQENIEKYLRERGWQHRLLGWYWVWTLSITVDNKPEQFSFFALDDAYAMEKCLQKLAPFYIKQKATDET